MKIPRHREREDNFNERIRSVNEIDRQYLHQNTDEERILQKKPDVSKEIRFKSVLSVTTFPDKEYRMHICAWEPRRWLRLEVLRTLKENKETDGEESQISPRASCWWLMFWGTFVETSLLETCTYCPDLQVWLKDESEHPREEPLSNNQGDIIDVKSGSDSTLNVCHSRLKK